jgi:hypothetical protein
MSKFLNMTWRLKDIQALKPDKAQQCSIAKIGKIYSMMCI